jgi:hypothetical protein
MGLRQLLADLSSENGGFRQKNIGYNDHQDDGSIYNSTDEPFIEYGFDGENNVVQIGDQYVDQALATAEELDSIAGDLIRGGTKLGGVRRYTDYKRIEKFFQTPKGNQFLNQQVGLQLSNPRVDAPMKGALDNFLAFGLFNNPPDPNQTEYNPGISGNKTLIQVGLSGLVNTAREGVVPFVHFGYYNNFFKRGGAPRDTGMSALNKNRLVHLGTNIGHMKAGEEGGLLSSAFGVVDDIASGINKGLMWLGGGGEELYSYLGGPDSLYGIGTTIHRRWENTTRDVRRDEEWPSVEGLRRNQNPQDYNLETLDTDSLNDPSINPLGVKNYLRALNDTNGQAKPGFRYEQRVKKDSSITYHRESRLNLGDPSRKKDHLFTKSEDKQHLNYDVYDEKTIDKINALDIVKNTDGKFDSEKYQDLISFRIEAVDSDNPVNTNVMVFRAFLDSFGDNYNASYNEYKYNGRSEPFYTYDSFKRDISLSFKIAAQSRYEMQPLYRKLNYLVSQTAGDYHATSGRLRTPFIRLTVGNYLNRTPGIINSINITWQQDYPWEVALEDTMDKRMLVLPHALDVQLAFTPVHNFTPQKSITSSPFILPHAQNDGITLKSEQKWLTKSAQELSAATIKNPNPTTTTE